MTLPSLLIGILFSTLFGALFHLWRGGGAGRLLLYLVLAWIGFWAGHLIAVYFDWQFTNLGPLHLGSATLGCLIALGIGYWLSLVDLNLE